MDITKEKACLCAMNRIFGYEPRIALALISQLGNASNVFELNPEDMEFLLGPHSRYKGQICEKAKDEAAEELHRIGKHGIRFTGWGEEGYPELLKECPDAPSGLYIRSDTPDKELWGARAVSVVGTRALTPYGREWCTRTVREFARCEPRPSIVSGLAIGTDICAHRTALDAGLPTIAVMPTGPETVYPLRHTDLALRLQHTTGCALITDFPPGTAPLAAHFLRRNRIIAGLSEATILIESKIKGGGMMTANLAFSYGRGVYAVPGRIDDTCSQGCNLLIKRKIAEPIIEDQDLIQSMGMDTAHGPSKALTVKESMQQHYKESAARDKIGLLSDILTRIKKKRGITVEELCEECGTGYSLMAQMTGLLESDGFISIDLLQRCCINPGRQVPVSE